MSEEWLKKGYTMDTQAYIDQLKSYAVEFQEWWCKPYDMFCINYEKQNRSFITRLIPIRIESRESREMFSEAAKQFEKDVLQKRNLFSEIFAFLDVNYEAYISATDLQRSEVRSIIRDSSYTPSFKGAIPYVGLSSMGLSSYVGLYMQAIINKYIYERALKEFRATGDEIWLTRGLVAISIENCSVDYRDTITCLSKLYVAAERKNIDAEKVFKTISEISSTQPPKGGGGTSVSEMMEKIGSYAATNIERSMQK
jgi:hypothetical protein